MLKATIDAEIFRESIDAIAALVTECRLHAADDHIWTRAVDTANVAMVSLDLRSTAFSSFSATDGELGLDITKMKNILGMMGKGDALTLNLLDEDRKLELSFGGYRYSLTLLDVNTIRKDPNPPAIDLPGKAVISGDALNSAIKAAAVISDKIALGIDPDAMTFYMEAEGDTDHIKLALGEDELVALNPVRARSLFSLDYLKDMGRVMARADAVEVYLGIDHPVRFAFDIADGNGHVEYLLAPRIEAD
ncbi:DNA polymerase sliding clamp [Methanoculleus sp. 7T]|jgi:proliferating cell nuclear antigen|uniref:DNA polymerase sliding clamp n=1 Tax=Methanoculleus sp. 7T TaxID=2937282 RepID=UPI0020BE3F17|nr:DNA polymerase sliding clamp [Methanoculleus sp. 7T]MCK8519517.1 DNA polymerase sliding clamp [Methanoculleus sp. 7T]